MKLKVLSPKKDAFDDIPDAFEDIELSTDEKVLFSPEFQKALDAAVAKAVSQIKMPEPSVKETVKEIRVEVPKKDTRDLVEKSQLDAALKKIEALEKQLKETDEVARNPVVVPGGPGVIGIPPPEGVPENYVLTRNAQGKAEWKAAQGGNGNGVSLSGYTVTNGSSLKSFDVTDVSLDELARVLGQVITDLQA